MCVCCSIEDSSVLDIRDLEPLDESQSVSSQLWESEAVVPAKS